MRIPTPPVTSSWPFARRPWSRPSRPVARAQRSPRCSSGHVQTQEVDPLDERELLAVFNEAARRGNVSAARSLLSRRAFVSPQDQAREEFRRTIEERKATT